MEESTRIDPKKPKSQSRRTSSRGKSTKSRRKSTKSRRNRDRNSKREAKPKSNRIFRNNPEPRESQEFKIAIQECPKLLQKNCFEVS